MIEASVKLTFAPCINAKEIFSTYSSTYLVLCFESTKKVGLKYSLMHFDSKGKIIRAYELDEEID